MVKILKNIRVVELGTYITGPAASMHLADLGADVIKVERPGSGDDTRGWGPPFAIDVCLKTRQLGASVGQRR